MTLLDDALAVRRDAGLECDAATIARMKMRIECAVSSEQTDWRNGVKNARAYLARQPKRAGSGT